MTPPVWWNVVKNPNRLTKSVAPDFSTPITLGPHFYCHGHIWFATKAQQTSPGPGMRNENRAIYRTSFQSSHWILCFWLKTTMIRKKTMISYDKQQSSGGNYPLVNIQKTMERSTMFNGHRTLPRPYRVLRRRFLLQALHQFHAFLVEAPVLLLELLIFLESKNHGSLSIQKMVKNAGLPIKCWRMVVLSIQNLWKLLVEPWKRPFTCILKK